MSYVVLAYPDISKKDYNWIQTIREKYDDRFYRVVEPHFTIVFPVNKIEETAFILHADEVSNHIKAIDFSITCSSIIKDSFSDFYDIFLIPDTGNGNIVKLHNKLYTGILEKELKLDIPFIPHIGIGGSTNPEICKKISDLINASNFNITGKISTLDICWFEYPRIQTIEKIELIN